MAKRLARVTGATRGIARGIALDLARQGWAVGREWNDERSRG